MLSAHCKKDKHDVNSTVNIMICVVNIITYHFAKTTTLILLSSDLNLATFVVFLLFKLFIVIG